MSSADCPPVAAKKKRPWFQFHLSTAIALQLAAAGVLWLNIRVDPESVYNAPYILRDSNVMFLPPERPTDGHGWPWYYRVKPRASAWYEWHYGPLLGDALVALAILFALAAVLEWRIRRRELRQV